MWPKSLDTCKKQVLTCKWQESVPNSYLSVVVTSLTAQVEFDHDNLCLELWCTKMSTTFDFHGPWDANGFTCICKSPAGTLVIWFPITFVLRYSGLVDLNSQPPGCEYFRPGVLLPCHSRWNLNFKNSPHRFKNLRNEAPQEKWKLQGWPAQTSAWDRVLSQFWHNQSFFWVSEGVEALSILQQIWTFFQGPQIV